MFKSLKRRGEKVKERVDFKFGFHATRVPFSGWEKLVVSVIPLESGKVSYKTTRAICKNGTCNWPDNVIETTKLLRDTKTKEYDEKLYKFIVSTGSSRSGVLGEATVNVADYTSSNNPSQIALTLKNCNAGSILHATITCLTPRTNSGLNRATERNELALEEGEELSGSDDSDLDDSDLSGNLTTGSATSNTSAPTLSQSSSIPKDGYSVTRTSIDSMDPSTPKQNGNARPFASDSVPSPTSSMNSSGRQERDRDRAVKALTSQDSNNSSSSLPPAYMKGSSNVNGASSGTVLQGNRSYNEREWQTQRSIGSRSSSENDSKPNSQTNLGGKEALQADLAAAERTIDELRLETVATQRQNRKLTIEIETLKQQLNTHIRNGAESSMEMTTLVAERDRLKQELEQVRSSKLALEERESGDGNARWKAEDAQQNIRELQDEVRYYKEQNMNLNVQLRKTQDSNMEFVLAIKDIEEQLEQAKKENEELAEENYQLQESFQHKQRNSLTDSEQEWKRKLALLEEDKRSLESRLAFAGSSYSKNGDEQRIKGLEKMVERLKQDVEDLEKESKELANENMELYTILETTKRQLHATESGDKNLSQSFSSIPSLSDSAEVTRLKRLVTELENKLSSSKEKHDKQHTHSKHSPDAEYANKYSAELERSLSEARDALASQEQELLTLEERCSRAEEERSICLEKIAGLEDDMSRLKGEIRNIVDAKVRAESTVSRLNREKEELEERLRGAAAETGAAAEQIQEREAEMAQTHRRSASLAAKVKELEECLLELASEKAALEQNVHDLQEGERRGKSRVEEVEFQMSVLTDTMESVSRTKLEFEERAAELERAKSKLELENRDLNIKLQAGDDEEKSRQQQLAVSRLQDELINFREEKETFSNSKRNLERRASELESIKDGLESQLTDLEKENLELAQRVTGLEAQLRHFTEEREAYVLDKGMLERQLQDVQSQKSQAEGALLTTTREHHLKVSEWEAHLVTLLQEKQAVAILQQELQKQLERQGEESAVHVDTIRGLKERILQLETVQVDLEANLRQMSEEYTVASETISSLEGQLVQLRAENEDRTVQLLEEIEVLKDQNGAAEQIKVQDVEMLSMELQRLKNAFERVKAERDTLDASMKNITELNEYLQEEKSQLEEDINAWQQENEELKLSKIALEERIIQLQLEVETRGASHMQDSDLRSESLELRRQNIEFKQQLTEQEEEKEEFRKRAQSLEIEIQEKLEALRTVEQKFREKDYEECGSPRSNGGSPRFLQRSLSRSNSKINPISNFLSREAKELTDLREKVKLLEGEIKSKAMAIDQLKRDFSAKEAKLLDKIESLQVANEQLIGGGSDMGMEYLQVELQRLQNQNSSLARRERELQSQLRAQDVLQKEVQRLQEENEQLESRFSRFKETAKFGNLMDRVVSLETELAEAMEANAMYKTQLRNAFAKQDNVQAAALQQYGDVDQIITDLVRLKGHSSKLEGDVRDLRERYATMSLRYAEVEAQREELVMTVRNLRNGKKTPSHSPISKKVFFHVFSWR